MNEVAILANDDSKSLLSLDESRNLSLLELGEKARNASKIGNAASSSLRHYASKGFVARLWYDKEIKTSTADALKALNDMTEVAIQLAAVNLDNAIKIEQKQKQASDEGSEISEYIKKFAELTKIQTESLEKRLKTVEDLSGVNGSSKFEEELNSIKSSVNHLNEKQVTERDKHLSSLKAIVKKISHINSYYSEELHKRDKTVNENLSAISRSITKSKNEGMARVEKLKSSVHIQVVSAVIFMVLLNVGGLIFISKKIMANPAPSECIESPTCLIKWFTGL